MYRLRVLGKFSISVHRVYVRIYHVNTVISVYIAQNCSIQTLCEQALVVCICTLRRRRPKSFITIFQPKCARQTYAMVKNRAFGLAVIAGALCVTCRQ